MRVCLAALIAASCVSGPSYHLMGPVVRDIPAPAPPATRGVGPLSPRAKVADTPWPERQRLMNRADHVYLDRVAIHEDAAAYMALITELFPAPAASELKIGVDQARNETALLEKLAPYALDSVSGSFVGLYGRLPVCSRPPGEMWHCFPDLQPAPTATTAFEIVETPPGVTVWTIHDFDRAAAWKQAFDRVSGTRPLVIDMRDAAGTDPRVIIPWLERVTHRAPFKPLREIRRPADLDPHVATYAARFTTETRDRDAWASLVGTMPAPSKEPAPRPIAVIVGRGCGPVCELVTRSLATYAHATLYGGIGPAGRLDRDEPALMVLPHSKVEVYFFATEYLLAADIERATGPTSEWHLRMRDTAGDDIVAFAARELSSGPPKRCRDYAAYTTAAAIPAAVLAKIPSASWMSSCSGNMNLVISVETTAPLSALSRFAESCTEPVQFGSLYGGHLLVSSRSLAALSQLAQSELVTRIDIDCEAPPQPDTLD